MKTMKTITATELNEILNQHQLWIESAGKQGTRANLSRANLTSANLGYANLRGANLVDAYLRDTNLWGAELENAYLTDANLGGAVLTGANLGGANLKGANLCYANLIGANLTGASLCGANLTGANLRRANLRYAYLTHAYLTHADLTGASLRGANLTSANLTSANLLDANLTNTVLDEKKKEETKMNMENENGFILSSEEKDMVLEYRKKTAKEKKIKEIRQTATALRDSFRAIDQIAGGGTYCLEVGLEANTKLLQQVLNLFGTVNQQLHSDHSSDGQLQKQTLSFAMPSLDCSDRIET
jgi:uncharacterized protein YjbI with pentapeptide repeats